MKSIIFCSAPNFLWIFKKFTIYIRSSFSINKNKNVIFVRDDIFSASDYRYCDHKASLIEDELINKIINKKNISFLLNWGGEDYANFFIGKQVIKEAKQVFESFDYANKVYSYYSLLGVVYVFPVNFSLKVYKEMRYMDLLPKKIKIHPLAIIYLYLYNLIKFLYFFTRMLVYPEIIFAKAKNKKTRHKTDFSSCAYLDDGLMGFHSGVNRISDDNKIFRLFNDSDTLFVDDRFQKSQLWPKITKKIGKQVLRLEDTPRYIGKIQYLKYTYIQAFKWRLNMILLSLRYPFLVAMCSRATRLRILWEVFYCNFSIKNAIRMMVEENLTSSIVHKKNKTKTIFVYFSTTSSITKRVDHNKSMCHDYTHMIVDNVMSSRISNNWLKTLENNVGHYITLGPIFSDLVSSAFGNKREICDKIKINHNSKIISFFDHTVGYSGVMTFKAFRRFIDGILMLAKENPDIYFLFKSKKVLSILRIHMGEEISSIINSIEEMPNCIYANEFDLTTYEVIGVSDLVISAPMSSVIFEALCGGIKAVSFDPLSQYVDYDVITNTFPKFNAVNYSELEKLFNYWLHQASDKDFDVLIDNYVRPRVDQECCKNSMIDRFKEILNV